MYSCQHCGLSPLPRRFHVDANAHEVCQACYEATRPPVVCEMCGDPCPVDDRLPTKAKGHAHARCNLKASRAFMFERTSVLLRRTGPAFRGQS